MHKQAIKEAFYSNAIGVSEIAAVMGTSRKRSLSNVKATKDAKTVLGPLDDDASPETDGIENAVIDLAMVKLDSRIRRNHNHKETNLPFVSVSDGLLLDRPEVVDVVLCGLRAVDAFSEEWGPDGSGASAMPLWASQRLQWAMWTLGPDYEVGWCWAVLGGMGVRKYRVERNQDQIDMMVNRVVAVTKAWSRNKPTPPVYAEPVTPTCVPVMVNPRLVVEHLKIRETVKADLLALRESELALHRAIAGQPYGVANVNGHRFAVYASTVKHRGYHVAARQSKTLEVRSTTWTPSGAPIPATAAAADAVVGGASGGGDGGNGVLLAPADGADRGGSGAADDGRHGGGGDAAGLGGVEVRQPDAVRAETGGEAGGQADAVQRQDRPNAQ